MPLHLGRVVLRFLLAAIALTSGLAAQPGRPGAAPGGPWEWRTEFSGAGTADIAEGTRALGSIRHTLTAAELTRRMTINAASSLSIGGAWRSFDFAGSTADVPGQLQSIALRVGYDRQLSAKWSLGIDVTPGFYSDFEDLDSSDVNVPFGFRLMSANSRDFQWGIALMVDPWRPSLIIGGPGVRWQFAPGWTFVGFPPEPRVEYALTPTFSLHAGMSLRSGTFRVAQDFGRRRGRPLLDNQRVDFREITVGVGGRWQILPGLTAQASVGWMTDRRFEYEERKLLLNGDGAASFVISLRGGF